MLMPMHAPKHLFAFDSEAFHVYVAGTFLRFQTYTIAVWN